MKKNRILISILASSILLSSCSNLFESFLNEDEKAKTGDDSLTKTSATASYENDESTNTEIDKGLVVIKSSRSTYNQITYSASQKDYVVGSDSDVTNGTKVYLTSADNPVTLKCLTNDSHSTVEWTAVQTHESVAKTTTSEKTYTDTADSSKKSTITTTTVTSESLNKLNEAKDLTSSLVATADSKNQIQAIDLPYGTTVVTAKVTADDPQYNTTYTITLTKRRLVGTTEKISELKSLSVIPANTTNSDGTAAAVWDSAFTPDDRSYEVTVDEDCDELTFNFGTGSGVEVAYPLVAANKYGTVLESDYTVLLSGGRTTYTIPVKDSDGSVKTYSVTVVKPEDGDTSLQSFDYSPASSYANGVKSTKSEALKTDMGVLYADIATATNGTFAYTASADNRVDVTSMSFIAVPTHKYTTVAYYVGDTCPDTADTSSDKWSTSYTKADELALHDNLAANKTYAKSVALDDDNTTTTLWMKTTTKAYKHSLTSETKTSDVTYHKAIITKAGKGNTKLTALYAMADYQNDSDKSESKKVLNLTTDSEVAYQVPGSTQYTKVTTYADSITFYMRTLDKSDTDATKSITYTAVNTEYVSSANTSFTGYASTATSTAKYITTEKINGLEYYKFTIGTQDADSDTDTDLPDGKTTVTIYVDGTPASTMVYTKPDKNCTSLGGLGYTGAEGKGNNTFYIYIDNTVENVTLNSTTQQQDATITSSASYIEGTDGAAVTEATVTTISVQVTANPVEWTTTIGGTGTDALKEGKTKATLTLTNNGHTATYYVYIIKSSNTETRLKTLTVDGAQVSGYDWDSDYSTDSTIYYVAHSTSEATLAATALSSGASIGVTNSSLFTSKDDAIAWDGTTSATTFIESATSPVSKSTGALTGGYVVYDVKVTSADTNATRVYRIVMTVDLDMNAKLSTFTATQNGATSTYYNKILAGLSSETSYSKNASLDYTGDIVVNATVASAKSTLGTPTVTDQSVVTDLINTGVTVDSTLYKAAVNADDKSITIPYALYNYYAGKSIVVTYTVTAEAGNTQNYVLTINIPKLVEAVSPKTGTICSGSSTYTYSVDYTRRMGYRFGSQRSDATYGDFCNKFGGIDVVGSNDNGSSWIVSSFKCSGWIYCLNIDGTDYWVTLGADGKTTALAKTDGTAYSGTDVSLTVTPSIKYEGTGADAVPYLILKHEVTNTSGKTVKLGAMIDTLVDTYSNNGSQSADKATITPTNYGFDMANAGYKFSVILNNATGVDKVDNLWYGEYGKEDDCMWDNTKEAMKTSGVDTAVSYSWNGSASGFTKTIRMSLIAN